ncbi:MAG TPA: hypothetical protein VHM19_19515 [Polyangiales bacterium]|nr:hypothetical protein [Polyangiales bacterium]
MTIEIITLQCAGDCADIQAVAHGGNAPYTFAWDDGSTSAMRHVCLDASSVLRVQATDTAVQDNEFHMPAQTASAEVTATLLGCSSPDYTCGADGGMQAPERLKPDIFGMPTYFAGGAALPAGKYRLTYVDGCLRYQGGGFAGPADDWDWTVQGAVTYQFLIIGETTAQTLGAPPSATGQVAFGGTTYKVFEDCVNANLTSTPLELDFAGGKLGIWQNDFQPSDNVPGPDGRTPTWELSRVCD